MHPVLLALALTGGLLASLPSAQAQDRFRTALPQPFGALVQQEPHERYIIGVAVDTLQPGVHKLLGLDEHVGLLVTRLVADRPAAQAGLELHDLILAINDKPVGQPNQLVDEINTTKGDPIRLEVRRGSESLELTITPILVDHQFSLGEVPQESGSPESPPEGSDGVVQTFPFNPAAPLEFNLVGPGVLPPMSQQQFQDLKQQLDQLREQQRALSEQFKQLMEKLDK